MKNIQSNIKKYSMYFKIVPFPNFQQTKILINEEISTFSSNPSFDNRKST